MSTTPYVPRDFCD